MMKARPPQPVRYGLPARPRNEAADIQPAPTSIPFFRCQVNRMNQSVFALQLRRIPGLETTQALNHLEGLHQLAQRLDSASDSLAGQRVAIRGQQPQHLLKNGQCCKQPAFQLPATAPLAFPSESSISVARTWVSLAQRHAKLQADTDLGNAGSSPNKQQDQKRNPAK